MLLGKSTPDDLTGIMDIIKQAQTYMNENGIDQWQDNYPDENVISNDIKTAIAMF